MTWNIKGIASLLEKEAEHVPCYVYVLLKNVMKYWGHSKLTWNRSWMYTNDEKNVHLSTYISDMKNAHWSKYEKKKEKGVCIT